MEVIAKSTFVRSAPRKLRLVADQVRGLNAQEAIETLKNLNKRAAEPILLALRQGIGNAVNNFNLEEDSLKIKALEISRGPIGKRWRFVARGRVHQAQKKTSHIRMVLEGEKSETKKQESKRTKKSRPRLRRVDDPWSDQKSGSGQKKLKNRERRSAKSS